MSPMPVKTTVFDPQRQKVPAKIWSEASSIEPEALNQLQNMASLPFVFKHVAAMPDVHLGKGATVGSVIATKNAVIPAAVGVDIGCGMMAVKTPLDHRVVQDKIRSLRSAIEEVIPLGRDSHKRMSKQVSQWKGWKDLGAHELIDKELVQRARLQLGTLGGGNHFIEVCLDLENNVWIMLHSGSRNIGKSLAERHINRAKGLMKQHLIGLPDPDLAYLEEGTSPFKQYIEDLHWCQGYAFQNRIEMMDLVFQALAKVVNNGVAVPRLLEVNCHHNYTQKETHFGEKVWLTRKGAVNAAKDQLGIIPGSMGTKSYIVRGLGNAESFHSCSHGAGRRMSRSEAKRRYTLKDLADQTVGVESRKDAGVIDEIPAAYKDIDQVMANQTDLVEVVAQLKQIMCVKG
jgi:tRNA-splicing ligase RtcB